MIVTIGNINQTPLFFYMNETNYFFRNAGLSNFTLGRIKYNFVVYLKMKPKNGETHYCALNIPGEIADIPVPKFNDYKTEHFTFNDDSKTYKHIRNEGILLYNSYTGQYFIEDMYNALFKEVDFPWTEKYKKNTKSFLFNRS